VLHVPVVGLYATLPLWVLIHLRSVVATLDAPISEYHQWVSLDALLVLSFCEMSNEKEELTKLLARQWRVRVSDGRVFIGKCLCLDQWKNLILSNTIEYFNRENQGIVGQSHRQVGFVMIPGAHITQIQVQREQEQQSVSV
jgi:small nuclear ribonucleoprotein (snRNP)-like protein